jgi:hypothetical protein
VKACSELLSITHNYKIFRDISSLWLEATSGSLIQYIISKIILSDLRITPARNKDLKTSSLEKIIKVLVNNVIGGLHALHHSYGHKIGGLLNTIKQVSILAFKLSICKEMKITDIKN